MKLRDLQPAADPLAPVTFNKRAGIKLPRSRVSLSRGMPPGPQPFSMEKFRKTPRSAPTAATAVGGQRPPVMGTPPAPTQSTDDLINSLIPTTPNKPPSLARRVHSSVVNNPEKVMAVGGAAAAPLVGAAALASADSPAAPTPKSVATQADAAGPDPFMPKAEAAAPPTAGTPPAMDGHLAKYWPGYAAGGLATLALANMIYQSRRKKRPQQKLASDFAAKHQLVAGFLVKCAEDNLSHTQIAARVTAASLLDPDVAQRFQAANEHPFLKDAAGLFGNMLSNAGRMGTGLLNTAAGAVGSVGTGLVAGGANAYNAIAPKHLSISPTNMAGVNGAFKDSLGLTGAGAKDVWNSTGGVAANAINPNWAQESRNVDNWQGSNYLEDTRNRPGVTEGAKAISNGAEAIGNRAGAAALTLGAPGAIANVIPGAASVPGVSQLAGATQFANQPLGPALAAGGATALQKGKDFLGAMRTNPVATTTATLGTAEGAQAVVNSATPPVVDDYGRPLGETHVPVSATGLVDKAISQPYQKSVYDAADAAHADQQLAQLGSDPNASPEQQHQAVTQAIAPLKQPLTDVLTKGPTPEQEALGQKNLGSELAKADPESAQQPGFFDQVSQSWANMDGGQKALMIVGGGLGLLGLARSLSGNGGVGDWLMTLLGLGAAGMTAGNAGMFGSDAQNMLGGFGKQIADRLPFGNNTAQPPGVPKAPAAGQNPNIPNGNPQSKPVAFQDYAKRQLDQQVLSGGRKQFDPYRNILRGIRQYDPTGLASGQADSMASQKIRAGIEKSLLEKGVDPKSIPPEDYKRWEQQIMQAQ